MDDVKIRDRIRRLDRVPASSVRPSPHNWRTHPKNQSDALKGILAELGFAGAILARELPDGALEAIDGHLRLDTMGNRDVPVLVTDLDDAEAKKLLATFDPIGAMATADAERLDKLLKDVSTDNPALQELLDGLAHENGLAVEPGAGGDEFDPTPEATGPTRTNAGELWVIGGKHRLLVGDCTDAEVVKRVMGGEKAGLCFTSPPYAQQRDYGEAAKEKVQDWYALMCGAFACLPMTDDGQVLVNLGLVHRDGEWVPYWSEWIEWMRSQGWRRFGWYVWDQGPGLPGDWSGRLAPSFEFVWHFNRSTVKPEKTVECKTAGVVSRNRTFRNSDGTLNGFTHEGKAVQPTKIPDSVIRVNRDSSHGTGHPAVFPILLPTTLIECWPADVYDPFLGSGTTLIAAHRLGRVCYGCEIEPRYADVILKRAEAEGLECNREGDKKSAKKANGKAKKPR